MNYQKFVKAAEAGHVTLVFIGKGYMRGEGRSYPRYKIVVNNNELNHENTPWLTTVGYYVKRSRSMAVTCGGMDQFFAARFALMSAALDGICERDQKRMYKLIRKIKGIGVN